MSINTELQLPGPVPDPTSDSVVFIPLGGDGWSAPQSAYSVHVVASGDASGNEASIEVAPDPQYVSLVQYMSFRVQYSTGNDISCRTAIRVTKGDEVAQKTWFTNRPGGGLDWDVQNDFGFNEVWAPPGLLISSNTNAEFDQNPRLTLVAENDASLELVMSARILNFQKRVREEVPLSVILSSLPR